ncbi:S-layer homology domain-containing protein [Paenibacillus soyae]|uniref:S-layer homology domain-containing protein n=1 Tax=Paenibacillus soyae TaxID=2969249 RepID=A0A9X2MIJ0_9BACL|nr:S-layer homology domain-containing protein [Paenibacillus soyae]MCR2802423.1 S-layer homology domain-containing protein [Paenibacillus soyae]
MNRWRTSGRWTSAMLAALLAVGTTTGGSAPAARAATDNSNVVISQVYGGGGNNGATWKNDFIELYNPTDEAISLDGWQVQYASATAASWPTSGSNIHALTGTIPAGGYYLLQQAAGSGGTADLPTPDAIGTLTMGATNGKVRLINASSEVVDLVGFGSANEAESEATPVLSNSTAAIRLVLSGAGRGLDTNNNKSDFAVGAPDPRNSSYGSAVEAVTSSPAPGAVVLGTEVTLSTATPDAAIYYRIQPAGEYSLYKGPIAIMQDAVIEAYATKNGLTDSPVQAFAFIADSIMPILDARVLADGTAAIIEGIVTHKETSGGKNNLYVQDDTAGIIVRGANLEASVGDRIRASGKTLQYFGLAELEVETAGVSVIEPNAGVPEPMPITAASLGKENGEAFEGEYVEAGNVTAGASNAYNEFTVSDGEGGTMLIKSPLLETGKTYEAVRGVVTYSFNNYMLVPRSEYDVIERRLSVKASPSPTSFVQKGTAVTLTTPASGGAIYYTTGGSEPTAEAGQLYTTPIIISENTVVKAIVAKDGEISDVFEFGYTVQETYDELEIHDIQGASHVSPYEGHLVSGVQGVVTMRRPDGSWFIQAPEAEWDDLDATSEGILIAPAAAVIVSVGDLVTVGGTVQEAKEEGYADAKDLFTTRISATSVTVDQREQALPAPIVIGEDRVQPLTVIDNDGKATFDPDQDSLDFYESLEGMRLQVNDARIVGPFNYEIPVVPGHAMGTETTEAGGVILTGVDLNPQRILIAKEPSAKVKTGDKFTAPIIGVLSYDYSNYKIMPEALPDVEQSGNEREAASVTPAEDKLTIASFNIENFWNNPSSSETLRKERIAASIVDNLKSPDIVALIEVQDNNGSADDGTTDAKDSYEALIKAIEEQNGPTYLYTDIAPEDGKDGGEPGGNIRAGYLYNPERVKLVVAEGGKGDAVTGVEYGAKGLTLNPGRIDPTNEAFEASRKPLAAEFEFKGDRVVVIANHFNSKGGDEAPYGAVQPLPETLGSEAQRHKIAKIVHDFASSILQKNKKANVVVLGDLNDFQFSRTLDLTKGSIMENLVDALPVNERYSYIYQGNSQTLDHILVNKKLAKHARIDIVHINADFDRSQGRVSDHDPLLTQLDLKAKRAEDDYVPPLTPNPNPGPDPKPEKPDDEDGGAGEEKPPVKHTDVAGHWALESIGKAVRLGFIAGYGDGTFRPDNNATRAEFAVMLGKALGLEEEAAGTASFPDQDDIPSWARSFVALLAEEKVVGGYEDGTFRPMNQVSRTEMTVMLVRALGLDTTQYEGENTPFTDDEDIPSWSKPYIAAAFKAGLIQGMSGNRFVPDDKATRAEIVTILLRALEKLDTAAK